MGVVNLYKWDDAGAPQLTNAIGSAIQLFNACLVDGYGSKSPAGWTKAYDDYTANKRVVYKQGGTTGQHYLQILDGAQYFFTWAGYENMTSSTAGTNCFAGSTTPTNTAWSSVSGTAATYGGRHIKCNTTAITYARWYLIADERTFYFFVRDELDPFWHSYQPLMFGDIYSVIPGDLYKCAGIGGTCSGVSIAGAQMSMFGLGDDYSGWNASPSWPGTGAQYLYMQNVSTSYSIYLNVSNNGQMNHLSGISRNYDGTVQSQYIAKGWSNLGMRWGSGSATNWPKMGGYGYGLKYPDPVANRLVMSPVYVSERYDGYVSLHRGYLRGIYAPCHFAPFYDGTIITGTGDMAGKQFIAIPIQSGPIPSNNVLTYPGQVLVEITSGWMSSQ